MGQMATEPAGVALTALIRMGIIPFHVTMVLASCFGTMNSPLLFMRWPRCVALLPPQASASTGLISCDPQGESMPHTRLIAYIISTPHRG